MRTLKYRRSDCIKHGMPSECVHGHGCECLDSHLPMTLSGRLNGVVTITGTCLNRTIRLFNDESL